MDAAHIRNFCIIAHIDHGKTTLSDRLAASHRARSRTGTWRISCWTRWTWSGSAGSPSRPTRSRCYYKAQNGETYELNLIDTPGHVDFAYEVSRSLSACEGALLIVDAAQGVEAQTVANVHLAMKQNLTIIPVINKIDLPHANVAQAKQQLEDILAIPADTAILASAKEGIGIDEILEAIVARVPPPKADRRAVARRRWCSTPISTPTRAWSRHVRVFNGELKAGMHVKLLHSGKTVEVKEVGSFNPEAVRPREARAWAKRAT